MPQPNEKVLAMVRQELEKDPRVTNEALLARAKRMNRSVGRLSPRQFHATYRLRASRDLAPARPRSRKPAKTAATKIAPAKKMAPPKKATAAVDRDAVRAALLDLATEVAAADRASIVGVIASLDRYVDRIAGATG